MSRRRLARGAGAVGAAFVMALSGVAILGMGGRPQPTITVERTGDGAIGIVVQAGAADASDLAAFAHGASLRDGVLTLQRPLEVAAGAEVSLSDVAVRLATGVHAASITVAGGRLELTHAHVRPFTSTGDRGTRPEIVARDAATLTMVESTVSDLGHDAAHPGLLVTGPRTHADIQGSSVARNFRGLDVRRRSEVSIRGTALGGNTETGFVASGADSVNLVGVTARKNGGGGFAVTGTSGTRFSDVEASENAGDGIRLTRAPRTAIRASALWGNLNGITALDSRSVTVRATTVSANVFSGVVGSGTSSLRIRTTRLDHNGASGVTLHAGSLDLQPNNRIIANLVGVEVLAPQPALVVVGNSIDGNSTDAFTFTGTPPTAIRDNRITGNGAAAFAVAQAGDSAMLARTNQLSENTGGAERVQAES